MSNNHPPPPPPLAMLAGLVALSVGARSFAAQLGISEEIAKAHVKSILVKLGARDRTNPVTLALERAILPLEGLRDML